MLGLDDDFFELGGHSLLAIKLAERIRRETGRDPPLRMLFERRTPEALAEHLERLPQALAGSPRAGGGDLADGRIVLSSRQRGLWLFDDIHGPGGAYNLPAAWRLGGPLDTGALAAALADLIGRHEPLRTVIDTVEGEPVGRRQPRPDPLKLIPLEDVSALPARTRDEALTERVAAEAGRPFDLTRDLMVRTHLFRLGVDDHVLTLVIHHASADGVSMAVIQRELAAAYAARTAGCSPDLPRLHITYADHAAWLREKLEGGGGAAANQIAYWRDRLAGAPDLLDLPSDRPRLPERERPGGTVSVHLPPGASRGLEALAVTCGATLFTVVLSGWAAVLARLSRQDDIVIGVPIACRDREETENLVGFFANILPLRLDLAGRPCAPDLVGRVARQLLDGLAHQDVSFERLVEDLAIPRSPAYAPVTQVFFAWQNQAALPLALAGLSVSPLPTASSHAKVDLVLSLSPDADGSIGGPIEFDASLFDHATVARWSAYFERTLEAMARPASNPGPAGTPVASLPILDPAERRLVLEVFSEAAEPGTERRVPAASVARIFEAQADLTPQAVAVAAAGQEMTYRALDGAANRLAHHLIGLGVGPGAVVAVALQRSPAMVVALLAILKAGGAYLPIDAADPASRLKRILLDAGAVLTVVDRATHVPGALLRLDDPIVASALENQPDTTPPATRLGNAGGGGLAYVTCTSGSTGPPKAVATTHANVVSLAWRPDYAPLGPGQSVLQFAPLAFDAATFEIWGALLNGARLVLAEAGELDLDRLADTMAHEKVDTLWLTARLFAQVVRSHPRLLDGVRRLLAGGEPLPVAATVKALQLWPSLRSGERLRADGGDDVRLHACCPGAGLHAPRSSIGRPIPGTRLFVLDAALSPVPVGVVGELYIAGSGACPGISCPAGRYRGGASWPARSVRPAPVCTAAAISPAGGPTASSSSVGAPTSS